MSAVRLEIAIALVFRDERLLVTRRPAGVHLAGFWEFPGGKLRAGETALDCAVREVAEETGVIARAVRERAPIEWSYPERSVLLRPVDCAWLEGEGELRGVAELSWLRPFELSSLTFPPANAALIAELVAPG